jgi:hypothetical protein
MLRQGKGQPCVFRTEEEKREEREKIQEKGRDAIEKQRIEKTLEIYRKWCLECRNDNIGILKNKKDNMSFNIMIYYE